MSYVTVESWPYGEWSCRLWWWCSRQTINVKTFAYKLYGTDGHYTCFVCVFVCAFVQREKKVQSITTFIFTTTKTRDDHSIIDDGCTCSVTSLGSWLVLHIQFTIDAITPFLTPPDHFFYYEFFKYLTDVTHHSIVRERKRVVTSPVRSFVRFRSIANRMHQ